MAEVVRGTEPDNGGASPPSDGAGNDSGSDHDNGWQRTYWRWNLGLMVVLLAIWFIVAFGGGIIFVEQLNKVEINNFPLGYWIAQQGSIYVFVLLILAYALLMDRLDIRFGVRERDDDERGLP